MIPLNKQQEDTKAVQVCPVRVYPGCFLVAFLRRTIEFIAKWSCWVCRSAACWQLTPMSVFVCRNSSLLCPIHSNIYRERERNGEKTAGFIDSLVSKQPSNAFTPRLKDAYDDHRLQITILHQSRFTFVHKYLQRPRQICLTVVLGLWVI